MSKTIIWTPEAKNDLEIVIDYLEKKWSKNIADEFLSILFKEIERVQINPKQFPFLSKKFKYRKCIITKQNTLFYKEFPTEIVLLRIFDTRQNSNKINL